MKKVDFLIPDCLMTLNFVIDILYTARHVSSAV